MNNIVCSTQVHHYIPQKNATVDTFLVLGDQLNEREGNSELITYLSSLYPGMTDFDLDLICEPLQAAASAQNAML